jgi:hypothetical protein
MPLGKVIESIQQSAYELAESNRKARMDERYKATSFIETADASECLYLINELIERVSSITGEAGDLEDAACVLIRHIENERE